MTWGIALGLIGIGLWAWDHWLKDATPATLTLPGGMRSPGVPPASPLAPAPGGGRTNSASAIEAANYEQQLQAQRAAWQKATPSQRAAMCGLEAGDAQSTDTWTAGFLSPALPLAQRLELMRGAVFWANWPTYAKRMYCFTKGP